MSKLTYPLQYLSLRRETGSFVARRDVIPVVVLVCVISSPFFLFPNAIFFAKDGFLDHIRALASGLTGFYVAALVAAATFTTVGSASALDQEIHVGKIYVNEIERVGSDIITSKRMLSRREYLCRMFGYMAFLSLSISIGSSLAVVIADPSVKPLDGYPMIAFYCSIVFKLFFSAMISHLVVTTSLGLYHLVDRLYDRVPAYLPSRDEIKKQ